MKKIAITILIIAAGAYFTYTQFIFNNINTKIFSLDGAVSKIQKEIDSPYVLYNGKKIILGNNLGASITAAFPADLNNFAEDDTIEEEDLNAIEQTIGKTNSATSTTHDYLIRHGANTFDMAFNQVSLDFGLSAATGTFTGVLTADGGFAGKSSTTAAFSSNPSNCSAGQYPLGIDDTGAVESCTADVSGTSNWQFIGPNAVRPTTTVGIIINASSTISQVLNLDNYLSFTATSTPTTPAVNHLSVWASSVQGHTRLMFMDDDAITFTLGRDNFLIAKNTSGATINKGQAVYVTGSTGNVPNIGLAQANSTSTLPAIGLASGEILNNAFGYVNILGIISSIDTSAFATGDRLFVSPTTAGALTNARPTYSNFVQRVGSVMVSGVGNGSIYVTIAPFIGGEENWTGSATGFTAKSLTISANGSATTTIASGISTFAGGLISQASSTFNGSITVLGGFNGNASTADALFVNPTDCTNQFANAIAASGNLTCASVVDAYVDFTALTLADFTNDSNFWTTTSASSWLNSSSTLAIDIVGNLTGNADTATALAANGANCTNQFPLGVNTLGAVESCTTITTAYMDLTTITLADFTNDGDYFKWANATSTYLPLRGGTITGLTVTYGISAATSTITATSTASSLAVGTSNLYVSENGKVGIGTATPQTRLNIAGTSMVLGTPKLSLTGSGLNAYMTLGFGYLIGYANVPAEIGFQNTSDAGGTKGSLIFATRDVTTDTAPTERMRIDSAGNVGVGTTTPTSLFTISSTGSLALPYGNPTVDNSGEIGINTDQASSSIRYYDGTAERAIFDVFEKSFWVASTTDDENNNSFNDATSTFSLWNPARRITLVGLFGKTDVGTVNFACGDGTNWTETIVATATGVEDDGSMVNDTFTQRENFQCKIGSAATVPSKITITAEFRYEAD